MSEHVELVDVSLRDGLQDEPRVVSTEGKLRIAQALIDAGVTEIEATSFVHPKWVPQLADADAFVPRLPRGAAYTTLIMNVRGIERALAAFAGHDPDRFSLIFVASASPRHNAANNNRTIEATLELFDQVAARAASAGVRLLGGIACAFVSPWPDEVVTGDDVLTIVRRYLAGGCRGITLADTVGRASPRDVARRLDEVRPAIGVPLALHLHDSSGYALANVYAGLERGVRRFEAALAGLGGCPWAPGAPGNLDLERLTAFLEACGCETGIDRDALARAAVAIRAELAVAVPVEHEPVTSG